MHFSLLPTSPPPEPGPLQALLERSLAWLREELEGARPERKAAIRHELGYLEQLAGRDPRAVREQLAAANAWPRFKEPVEHLIVLIERHRSFKNLETLLEHLVKTADGTAEQVRAHLLRAWCALLHDGNEARAHASLDAALGLDARDPLAIFSREYFARRAGRLDQAAEALAVRLQHAADPVWGALLQLELGELLAHGGHATQAFASFGEVAQVSPEWRFAALEEQARLGERSERPEWVLASARARADLIVTALGDASSSVHVPAFWKHPAHAVHALLSLARLEQSFGQQSQALFSLGRAARLDPGNILVRHAELGLAFESADADRIEALAPHLLASATPEEAAALWTRLAQSRVSRNEPALALEALERALAADAGCTAARALQFDLLRGTRDDSGRAHCLARLAEHLGEAGVPYWLLAAHAWVVAEDLNEAQHALERAEAAGAPRASLLRVTRALAAASGDRGWYANATRSLLESEPGAGDRAGLVLELWREARLARDSAEEGRRLSVLEQLPESQFAARVVNAYASATAQSSGAEALAVLTEAHADASLRATLEWCGALRLAHGGDLATARTLLERLHAEQPDNAVFAGTLIGFCERDGGLASLPALLRRTAAQRTDSAFAASLLIEAGVRSFRAGAHEHALSDFQSAERRASGSAAALLEWAARAAHAGEDVRLRDPVDRLLRAVERVVETNPPSPSALSELSAATRNAGEDLPEGLLAAARLWALLAARAAGSRADPHLLERLAAVNPDCAQLCDAFRHLEASAQSEVLPKSLEESARRWAASSRDTAAALEWLAAASRLGPRERETQAWQWLAALGPGPIAEAALCNAALSMQLASPSAASARGVPLVAGSSPEVRLTNLETSPPGCDPRRRALALEGVTEVYGDSAAAFTSLLRGYNLLALGDGHGAAAAFRQYVDHYPDDPAGWEGLLSAARTGDDPALLAEAAAALGNTSRDPAHAARLLEEAAEIFLEQLHDDTAAAIALSRAVELDVTRRSSVEHLLTLLREAGDAPRILELVQRRLSVCPPPTDPPSQRERAGLEWERARAARELDDLSTTEQALQQVLELAPEHSGALALLGEVHLTHGRHAEAAELLARLAQLEHAPAAERVTSGLFAADLFENQLSSTSRAVEVLTSLNRAGLTTLAVRERLARAAAKSEAWDDAVAVLEQLMFERPTPAERAEAARLALCIHRDRRKDPAAAGLAAKTLLELSPADSEALDLVLSGQLDEQRTQELWESGKSALSERLLSEPLDAEALERLLRMARRDGDVELEQVSLGTLAVMGKAPAVARAELEALERRIVRIPRGTASTEALEQLRDPAELMPLTALLSLLSPDASRAFGHSLDTFRLGRRDRVPATAGGALRSEIEAWMAAFGVPEFELYRSSTSGDRLDVIPSQPPAVVVGPLVASPLGPFQRRELARALFAIRRGLGVLSVLDEPRLILLVRAAANLAEVPLEAAEPLVELVEFQRRLARALPRKTRRSLPELVGAVARSGAPLSAAIQAALSSLDRASAVAAGDPSVVVSAAPWEAPHTISVERSRRVARFMLSSEFRLLSHHFGASVT